MSHLKIQNLRQLSTEELIEKHDANAVKTTLVPLALVEYYLNEINRREQNKQNQIMIAYTKNIKTMTIIITIATLINLILFIISYCSSG